MPLDPKRLLVLTAVHRAGGVLAASRVLHLTPSAVSQQIARLEAETGAILLDRSRAGGGRPAVLTTTGHLLAGRGRLLAELLTETERDLAEMTGAVHGPVRIGAGSTAIRRLVAPAVARLAIDHPALAPHVVEIDEAGGRAALSSGALEILVVEADSGASETTAHPKGKLRQLRLLADPFHVVVPTCWARPDDIDVLLAGPWILGPSGSAAYRACERLAASHTHPTPPAAHQALEYPAVLALVGAGLGAALVPGLALKQTPHLDVRRAIPAAGAGGRQLAAVTRAYGSPPAVDVVLAELLAAV